MDAAGRKWLSCSVLLTLLLLGVQLQSRALAKSAPAPGALYLLYAVGPRIRKRRRIGVTPDEVRMDFGDAWTVERIEQGTDTGRGWPSAWYWLRKVDR